MQQAPINLLEDTSVRSIEGEGQGCVSEGGREGVCEGVCEDGKKGDGKGK